MTTDYKKLLANHGLNLEGQVAVERLRRAKVTLGEDLGLSIKKPAEKDRFAPALIKRLAGG